MRTDPSGDAEIERLKQQVQRGDFTELRQYLARTLRAQDWQDRNFVLNLLAPFLPGEALHTAAAAEPEAADLSLLLGIYYYQGASESRGADQAENTTAEQFRGAAQQIPTMMDCLLRSCYYEPADPVPHIFAMRGLLVFSTYEDSGTQEYGEALRIAPDCMPAYYSRVNARSEKWGGSHAESLQIARTAVRAGRLGSDLPACLFLAHFLVWQYARIFDKNKPQADQYLKNPAVTQELNEALDRWIGGNYEARRSSLPYLHEAALWCYLSGDNIRLKRILTLTGPAPYDHAWQQIGNPAKTHQAALLRISPAQAAPQKKANLFGWLKK